MIRRVDQFLPILVERDAVGSHAVQVAGVLEDMGLDTTLYAGWVAPGTPVKSATFGAWQPDPDAVCLYHLATGSPIVERLLTCGSPLVVNHHNITPPSWFVPWDQELAAQASWGRSQLARLAPAAASGIADSAHNGEELRRAGCDRVDVAPVLLDPARTSPGTAGDPASVEGSAREVRSGDWLFVGRMAPNKGQGHLVRAMAEAVRLGDATTRLHLVGGDSPASYGAAVRGLAVELGVADRVVIHGSVTDDELRDHYRQAGVFLCASEHEGFGVPLVEAMAHGLPVVAVAETAVPETVGDAGLLLPRPDPLELALAAGRVTSDRSLTAALVHRGRRRAAELSMETTRQRFREVMELQLEELASAPRPVETP